MGWRGADRGPNVGRDGESITDDPEIVELDEHSPPPAHLEPIEVAYLRDRRDPTGMAGIWRALEGL
jgi:hypothetical protein